MSNTFQNLSNMLGNLNTKPVYPNFEINPDLKLLTQQEILDFLKENSQKQFEIAEMQSKTADKQFKNNRALTILALVFAFISIIPVIKEFTPILQTKKNEESKYELENRILLQSNKILENQIKILQIENVRLSEKTKTKK